MKKIFMNLFKSNSGGDMKTSKEWYAEATSIDPSFKILDPDGWNRNKFNFSFDEEVISKQHFIMRVNNSTCTFSLDNKEFKIWMENVAKQ